MSRGPRFRAHCALALGFACLVLTGGCEQFQDVVGSWVNHPGAPSVTDSATPSPSRGTDVSVTELVKLRIAIPAAPLPPRPPKLTLRDADQLANQPAVVRSTPGVAIDLDDQQTVTVIAREELVGRSSTVGQFVADLLFAELQRRNVPITDRDYRVVKVEEHEEVMSGDLIKLTPVQRAHIAVGEQTAVGYYIVVHAVSVPNNPVAISVPWYVTQEDWSAYEKACEQYETDVGKYNAALAAYEAELERVCENLPRRPGFVDDGIRLPYRPGHVEELAYYVETHPKVVKKNQTEHRLWQKEKQERAQDIARVMSAYGEAARGVNPEVFERLQSLRHSRPARIHVEDVELFESVDDVVWQNRIDQAYTVYAFQGALSVRVIDLRTSQPIWFGLASAQNRDYTEAMAQACSALAKAMVGGVTEPR